MKIQYKISEDRKRLTLSIDQPAADALLLDMLEADNSDSDEFAYQVLEPLICNSELEWVDPVETGDLTEAPMLGIRDENDEVLERWAFMDYQVRSLVRELMDKREVTFRS